MWVRLRQVALVAAHLAPVLDDLRAVFGLEVAYRDPGVARFGLENAVLPVGHQFLEVVAPTRDGTAAGRYLERRHGDGGYMVIAHCDDHGALRRRVSEMGVRTVLELDHDGYQCLQLHPADTGGTFFEVDHQEGGEDPAGPWQPAGPNWQTAVRTDVVGAIVGVRVQVADRSGVAARWSAIAGVPATGDHEPVLALDNATVRFVAPRDDRGDGLAAVEVQANRAGRARAAAGDRGLLGDDGAIVICGTRFLLGPD